MAPNLAQPDEGTERRSSSEIADLLLGLPPSLCEIHICKMIPQLRPAATGDRSRINGNDYSPVGQGAGGLLLAFARHCFESEEGARALARLPLETWAHYLCETPFANRLA